MCTHSCATNTSLMPYQLCILSMFKSVFWSHKMNREVADTVIEVYDRLSHVIKDVETWKIILNDVNDFRRRAVIDDQDIETLLKFSPVTLIAARQSTGPVYNVAMNMDVRETMEFMIREQVTDPETLRLMEDYYHDMKTN